MSRIVDMLGPVPPLDDVARRRLERAVLAELERDARAPAPPAGRWRGAVLAAAVVSAAAVAIALWMTRPAGRAAPEASRFAAAGTERQVRWGDAAITLEPGAAVVATGDDATGVVVVIERGAARFEVAPREARPAFTVVAGEVEVTVVGTRFRVERQGDDAAVSVDEGVVRVERGDVETTLERGERSPAVAAAPAPAPTPTPAPAPAPAIEIEIEPEPEIDPMPALPKKKATPTRAPALVEPSPAERYAEAARLEASDVARARRIYQELATRGDGWGANALYALAVLESERGRAGAARRHLREYVERFPRGANAADARALLDRIR